MRVKRKDVTPEEWIRHRKLRKKIASAKWYAKKKKKEINEENNLRELLRDQLEEARRQRNFCIWETPEARAYARAVVDHAYRGYPVRPADLHPCSWSAMADVVERNLRVTEERGVWDHVPWDTNPDLKKCMRQLGMRELRYRCPSLISSSPSSLSSSDNNTIHINVDNNMVLETCSEFGLICAGLYISRQMNRWPTVQHAICQVKERLTNHNHIQANEGTIPPSHNPNPNQWYHHTILHNWVQHFVFTDPELRDSWETDTPCSLDLSLVDCTDSDYDHLSHASTSRSDDSICIYHSDSDL